MKTQILSFILSCCFTALLVYGCGPCREELMVQARKNATIKYQPGQVVYLKPDSCQAVITGTLVTYNYGDGNAYLYYGIRDCHGIDSQVREEIIYGLK